MRVTDTTPIDDAEWQAQERGLRAARGRDAGAPDASELEAAAASYRVIAKALRSSPRSEPPADFAADVVRRVASHEAGLERLVSRILLAVFLVASTIVGAVYGQQWWQGLNQEPNDGMSGWVLAAVGCVTLSWLCGRLLELAALAGDRRQVAWRLE